MNNQFTRVFNQHRHELSPKERSLQKSESIMQLMLRAWDRMPELKQIDNWRQGDKILVNNEHIGIIDAFAIINNKKYAWVEVHLGKLVQHFGIHLNDIQRVEVG